MKVTLVQMDVVPGQIDHNLKTIFDSIDKHLDSDIIAFPELCVGGYLVGDLWYDPDFIDELDMANASIQDHMINLSYDSHSPVVIYGNIDRGFPGTTNQDGRPRLFNCAIMVQENNVKHVAKTLLPNYRFFDDKRYFSAGEGFNVFNIKLDSGEVVRVGLEVCEDLWHDDYPIDPTSHLVELRAEYIFNISSSPYSYNKFKSRDKVINRTLKDVRTKGNLKNFFYVNCVGAQNNGKNIVTFDGDSAIYNGEGMVVGGAISPFKSAEIFFVTTWEESEFKPLEYSKEEYQYWASVVGIHSIDTIMGDKFPWIIGVSGGVDSAVVLALLKEAVGANRIHAFNLPTKYNSSATKNAAQKVCDALGVKLQTIPIQGIVDNQIQTLSDAGFDLKEWNIESIQAKIRGSSVLANIAHVLGGVMINNGNKLEIALGYCTLYGDVNGVIAPLGDLLKVEIWNMAKWINEKTGKEIIPYELLPDNRFEIPVPPSAELKSNQIDPMKWGYHDALLSYILNYKRGSLKRLCEAHKYNRKEFEVLLAKALPDRNAVAALGYIMEKYHLNEYNEFIKDLKWFVNLFDLAVYKRIQAPPIIVQSKSSFGYDHRESQLKRERNFDYI